MYKLDLEKGRNQKSNCQHPQDHRRNKRIREVKFSSISFSFIDYAKAFDCVDHKKLWKILKEMGIPDHLTWLLRNLYAVKKQQLETDMEKWTGSKLGKEYIKAVYCQPAHLIYMQSTSCEMPGWMKHKLESRLQGEISITSDADDTTLMEESEQELNSLLWKWKRRVKKLA